MLLDSDVFVPSVLKGDETGQVDSTEQRQMLGLHPALGL